MKEVHLPHHIDVFRYADQALSISGYLLLRDLKRLQPLIVPPQAADKVHVKLRFGVDNQGLTYIIGHLTTKPLLQCQRCMEAFSYEIISDFTLGVVKTLNEADQLPRQYDPILVKEYELELPDLIEDEIMLCLPIIPKHTADSCQVVLPVMDRTWEEDNKKLNPFHQLNANKKQTGKKNTD